MALKRSYSDKYVAGMGEYDMYANKNVDWMSGRFTKIAYVILVVFTWFVIHITNFFPSTEAWTITNIVHGVVCL